jgi:hypothetical protein
MKLPTIQRFQKQNYPGSPDWFTRFISDLNSFTEIVWNILNNNVTPADNMDAQVYQTTVLAGAAAADNAFQFMSTLNHNPQAILVGYVADTAAYEAPLANAVGIQWTFSGSTISVTGVTGLTAGHTYALTLVIL